MGKPFETNEHSNDDEVEKCATCTKMNVDNKAMFSQITTTF